MKNVINLVAAWSALGLLGSASAALVNQWSFDGDLLDSSGNGNDGTFTGGTEIYVAGQFGSAISLAAGDAVDDTLASLGNASAANSDISINLWLNLSAAPANLAYMAGIGGRDAGADSEERALLNFGSGFYFWGANADADSSTGYVVDNEWHMYTTVLDFDGAGNVTFSFFVDGDGSFYTPVTVARNMVAVPTEVGVGGTSLWGSTWAGAVDEFTVWDEALNPTEVSSLFATNQIPEPSAIALLGLGGLSLLRRKRQ